jgi:hypothetical protein
MIVQSTNIDVGIERHPHRLPRAATFLPVGMDEIDDLILLDAGSGPVAVP